MPANPQLDLTKVEIRPFTGNAVLNRFSSGKRPIDQFLKNKAKKVVERREHRVFCAHNGSSPNVIGYYSLQVGSDSVSELPAKNRDNYLKNYVAFPAIHLAFLGVDETCQRQGLGTYLLMDAFQRVAEIAEHCGFYALTLNSLDDNSTAFYKSLNFTIYSEGANPPKMLYPIDDILTLVRGSPVT